MNSMFNLKNKTDRPAVAVQPKLAVNVPGDSYEQEADAMAERVMSLSTSRNAARGMMGGVAAGAAPVSSGSMIGRSVQRKCAHCEEEEQKKKTVMRKGEGGVAGVSGGGDSGGLGSALSRSSGSGLPLPQATRGFMEGAFSADFSGVRVHADDLASEMSRSVRAKAFTYGNDIYFNKGQFAPGDAEGKKLLAHELTHVVQQQKMDLPVQRQPISSPEPHVSLVEIFEDAGFIRFYTSLGPKEYNLNHCHVTFGDYEAGVKTTPDSVDFDLGSYETDALEAGKTESMHFDFGYDIGPGQENPSTFFGAQQHSVRIIAASVPEDIVSPADGQLYTPYPGGEPQGPLVCSPDQPTAPEDMVQFILNQRGFSSAAPRVNACGEVTRPAINPSVDPAGVGDPLGTGYETNAIIQILDKDGKQVAVEMGQYSNRANPHAEAQAVAALRARLMSQVETVQGGKMIVAVDQVPCSGCNSGIVKLAEDLKLGSYEVWAPGRASMANPDVSVTPKTAARGAVMGTREGAAPRPTVEPEMIEGKNFVTPETVAGDLPPVGAPLVTDEVPLGDTSVPEGGGSGWGGGIMGVGMIGVGVIHSAAEQKRMQEERDTTGYAPVGIEHRSHGIIEFITNMMIDPMGQSTVPAEQRVNLPVWQKNLQEKAASIPVGGTIKINFQVQEPHLSFAYRDVPVTYERKADGTWLTRVPEGGTEKDGYVYFPEDLGGGMVDSMNRMLNGSESDLRCMFLHIDCTT